MKKWFLFLLIFALSFTCVACGKDDEEGDGDDTPTYDSLEMSKSESQNKVAELAQNGFAFDAEAKVNGETSKYTFGLTDNMFWIIFTDEDENTSGTAIKHENGLYHVYSYSDAGWEFDMSVTEEQDSYLNGYKSQFETWAFWCYSDSLSGFQKQGSASVAGRSCNKYSISGAGVVGTAYAFSYDVYIDQATGMTMKVAFTGQAGLESAAVSYEVTRFVTGGAVSVPKLPDASLPE